MSSPALVAYRMAFGLCPVILTGGIANLIPGNMLPLISITESLNFVTGLLGGASPTLDSFFANFIPIGASLISQDIGKFPFANQTVAANAVIAKQLRVSLLMICPARPPGGFAAKLAIMLALRAALNQHNASGGTYTIATPSYFYLDCLFLDMRDVTPASIAVHQPQSVWQLDFEQPLLSLADAAQAQNSLMNKITGGGQAITGQPAWSGLGPNVGQAQGLAGPSFIPAASATAAANVPGGFTTGAP